MSSQLLSILQAFDAATEQADSRLAVLLLSTMPNWLRKSVREEGREAIIAEYGPEGLLLQGK